MAGDFSRSSVNPAKNYAGVLMQQGRVQVDADWNEQFALLMNRAVAETTDVFGACGTNKAGDGFMITTLQEGTDLLIHPGQYWVNGLLCALEPHRMLVTASAVSATVVNVPSLMVDERTLAIGDWVALYEEGSPAVTAQVIAVDTTPALGGKDDLAPNTFAVTVSAGLGSLISAERLWLKRVVTFTTQPFLLNQWDMSIETSPANGVGSEMQLMDGTYVAVLEAWQREVSALDDAHIREVALGGPDTCERLQNVWQVHVIPYGGESSPPDSPLASPPEGTMVDCCTDFPGLDAYKESVTTTGMMNAQVAQGSQAPAPCLPITPTGYLGVSNQLYRVEVFQPGKCDEEATFVWSRDNAMVETTISYIDAAVNLYVGDLGKDDLHSFGLYDYVEIVDADGDLQGLPRFLTQITGVPIPAVTTSYSAGAAPAYQVQVRPAPPVRFQSASGLKLRRWDMAQTQKMVLDNDGNPQGMRIERRWTQIENNIEVNFSEGHYATASYWQIPARTATGDIEWPPFLLPNTNPIPQPPMGTTHHFCRLAIVTVTNGDVQVTDCRCKFPSLTSICAEDVCYHGTGCELEPVSTLEQALDELGARIRYHNKMLHGTGVVCGLGVSCGSGTQVNVAPGYAIDCEGYDLRVDRRVGVDLSTLVDLSPQQGELADATYELILERGGGELYEANAALEPATEAKTIPCCSKGAAAKNADGCVRFRAIACEKESFVEQWLDGTLLKDAYVRCIKPLVVSFQATFNQKHGMVSAGQALVSSLTNLVIQIVKPALTGVYISKSESQLLQQLYDWLLSQAKDPTMCSLLANAGTFPEYPLQKPMETMFGKGFKTRLRVSPAGDLAYAMGGNADLQIFDLKSKRLVNVVSMPLQGSAAGWALQDVALDNVGGINVVATNGTDSYFAQGTVADFDVTWTIQGSLSGMAFNSLTWAAQGVYGTVPGTGIYYIGTPNGSVAAVLIAPTAVTGQIVSWEESLYVTSNSTGDASTFNQVECYSATRDNEEQTSLVYPLDGATGDLTDDLAICQTNADEVISFVVSALNASAQKELFLYSRNNVPGGPAAQSVSLGETTTVRLAALSQPGTNGGQLSSTVMVSTEDSCLLQLITIEKLTPVLTPYAPAELHPMSLAYSEVTGELFVLNSTCNTVSYIPPQMTAFSGDDTTALATYRTNAISALLEVVVALLQTLKDEFCDLLLPDCPTCDERTDGLGVGLACITVSQGVVTKICNLEKRKYVKTFSTVGYWLSLVPVIPLLKVVVQDICCAVFSVPHAEKPQTQTVPPPAQAPTPYEFQRVTTAFSSANGEGIRYAVSKASSLRWTDLAGTAKQWIMPAGKLTLDSLVTPFKAAMSAAAPMMKVNQVTGMSLPDAEAALAAEQIHVAATQAYDPTALTANMSSYATAPAALAPGSSVTLVVDSNQQVRYYVPTPPVVDELSSTVQTNQAAVLAQMDTVSQTDQQLANRLTVDEQRSGPALGNVQALQTNVTALQNQIATMQTAQAQELAARDAEIAALTASAQQVQTKLASIDVLTAQVQALAKRLPLVGPKPVAAVKRSAKRKKKDE